MDKKSYIEVLKGTHSIHSTIKFKESNPEILNELFVKTSEIEKMEPGEERDKAILRLSIIAEFDAINLYEKFAELTENKHIKKVMLDVAREEKVHVGEFKTLLEQIDSEHEKAEEEGENEIDELI